MLQLTHTFLVASIPLATASIMAGVAYGKHTTAELESQLDPELQDRLCTMASDKCWSNSTDDEAYAAVEALGGRAHLLEQARLLLSLTIEHAKEWNGPASLEMEARFSRLALLLKNNLLVLLMPQRNAHLCVDIYAGMCTLWEQVEMDTQWLPMA